MIRLANEKLCTACGACVERCPKNCISMEERPIGGCFPLINKNECIECHSCERVCPILNLPNFEENMAQVRKSVDSPPGMLTKDHHHTVHEERQVCYSSHLRPKPLHL